VTGAGVDLAYEERGAGTPVLLIHDIASDHVDALAAAGDLSGDARLIAYSRRGYSGSDAPEPYTGTTVQEQAQDAAAVLRALAPQGAILAGEGFGALIALDVVLRHGALVRGAVLANPPLLAFVPDATRQLADQRARIEEAIRDGGALAGVDALLPGRASDQRRERARASAPAVFADYAGLASWPVTRRELRSLLSPAVVLTGDGTPGHIVAAADALAGLMPLATRRIDGNLQDSVRSLLTTA